MFRHVLAGLAVVLILAPTVPAGDEAKDKKDGFKIEGMLTGDEPKDKLLKSSPHKVHRYKMKAQSIHVIDLSSKDFWLASYPVMASILASSCTIFLWLS